MLSKTSTRTVALAAVLAGLITGLAPHSRANGDSPRCRPDGARLQAANDRIEVFWLRRGRQLYACVRGRRGRVALGARGSDSYGRPGVAVRGTLVAFGAEFDEGASIRRDLIVLDVLDPLPYKLRLPTFGYVANMKLRDARTVAWVACAGGTNAVAPRPRCRFDETAAVAVYKHDAGTSPGEADRLDEAVSVKATSLRLKGSELSWLNGTTPKSATLR